MAELTEELKKIVSQMIVNGSSVRDIMAATELTLGQIRGYSRRSGHRFVRVIKPKIIRARARKPTAVRGRPKRKAVLPPVRHRMKTNQGSPQPLPIAELKHGHCRWMLSAKLYCARGTVIKNGKEHSWCDEHYKRVFRLINVEH